MFESHHQGFSRVSLLRKSFKFAFCPVRKWKKYWLACSVIAEQKYKNGGREGGERRIERGRGVGTKQHYWGDCRR